MQQETICERLPENVSRKFLSNDYQEVSLRTICRNTGVTTGALYLFFKDKPALLHALAKDAVEAVMQTLYQHTSFEEEIRSSTDQLMDMEHDIHFARELIPFYYAHETTFEPLFNCSRGSAYQDFIEQIVTCLAKRNAKIISAMVRDDNTVFNTCTLHWLLQIRVKAFLYILSRHYSQEQALHQTRIVVTFPRGRFEDPYQQAVKNQIREILPFSFTA